MSNEVRSIMSFVVVVTLEPKPLPSLGLDESFTRIDYTAKCTMRAIVEDLARVLRVSKQDVTLLDSTGLRVTLEHTLMEYHDREHWSPTIIAGKWHERPHHGKRHRREINLKMQHTPSFLPGLVTCTVGGGEGRNELRRTTVQLPYTATFGELLTSAREQRYSAHEFEGPVYGGDGELETTLVDAWVRNGCKIDGTRHIGIAVVISLPLGSQLPLNLTMGPGDTINDAKQRVYADCGFAPSRQVMTIRGGAQPLEGNVPLKECCVSGVPVGGFSAKGWRELHLELSLKECVLPLDINLRAALGDEVGGLTSNDQSRFVGVKTSSQGCSGATPRLLRPSSHPAPPCPPPAGVGVNSGIHPPHAEVGRLAEVSPFLSRERSSEGRPAAATTTRHGVGGAYSMVVFALSPSGRALMLTVPQAATVLDAKAQLAAFEGVSPCRQRLLWRGVPMEPDSALLHKNGVRSGDTLIVGYRVTSRISTEGMAPVVELEGKILRDDTALATDVMKSQKLSHPHHAGGAEHVAVGSGSDVNGSVSPHGTPPARKVPEAAADGRQSNAVVDREDIGGGGGNGGVDVDGSDNARARNGGIDVIRGVQSGMSNSSTEGEGGETGGGVGGASGLPPPLPGSNTGHRQEKPGGRRTWWSKKKVTIMKRRGGASEEQGFGGLLVSSASSSSSPSSSSSSSSLTSAFDPTNSTSTHRVRVSPGPLVPSHRETTDDADGGGAGGVVRGTRPASAGAISASILAGAATRQQQPLALSGGRSHFLGWSRWKHGLRGPVSPAVSPDGGRG